VLHVVSVADDVRNWNYDGGLFDWYDLVDGRNFERGNRGIQYWNEGDGDYDQWRPGNGDGDSLRDCNQLDDQLDDVRNRRRRKQVAPLAQQPPPVS